MQPNGPSPEQAGLPTGGFPAPTGGFPAQSGSPAQGGFPPPGYPEQGGFPSPGYPQQFGPGPQGPPPAPRKTFPFARVGAAVTVAAGLVVLFSSLLDLYTVTVDPSSLPDEEDVSGTVEIGMGFYGSLLPTPMVAMAVPLLMLVAALTAVPGILGRRGQGALASAVSAIGATLLAAVLMLADPLPGVKLGGSLATDFQEEVGNDFSSVDELIDRLVDVSPGAGLIIALVVGVIASAGAVLNFLQIGEPDGAPSSGQYPPAFGGGVPAGPPAPGQAPNPMGYTLVEQQSWQRPAPQTPGYVVGGPSEGDEQTRQW